MTRAGEIVDGKDDNRPPDGRIPPASRVNPPNPKSIQHSKNPVKPMSRLVDILRFITGQRLELLGLTC